MFKKENTNFNENEAETIIGPSVKVEGDFVGQGNLVIDGIIKGNVKTSGNLKVGEKAKITASVQAQNAFVSGEIYGDIIIDGDLELTEKAKVFGDIQAKSLSIARGAVLNGKCTMEQTQKNAENNSNKDGLEEKNTDENSF